MSLASLLYQTRQSLSEFWAVRDARERTMLTVAAVVVAISLVYATMIAPALSGRDQLNKNLPALRQQVAQLQALSKEAAALSETSLPAADALSRENIEASLALKGLKPQSVTLSGSLVKLQLVSVSFSGTLNWLDYMQKTALLAVVDANIVALEKPDMVNATLTLRQPKNE